MAAMLRSLPLVERFRNSNHMSCHPGAPRRGEPGIHNPRPRLWIPGSPPGVGPRNDQPRYDRFHGIALLERDPTAWQGVARYAVYENSPHARSVAHQMSLLPATMRTPNATHA